MRLISNWRPRRSNRPLTRRKGEVVDNEGDVSAGVTGVGSGSFDRGRRIVDAGGIEDISTVAFRPNLATADAADGRRRAHQDAREVAAEFGSEDLAQVS